MRRYTACLSTLTQKHNYRGSNGTQHNLRNCEVETCGVRGQVKRLPSKEEHTTCILRPISASIHVLRRNIFRKSVALAPMSWCGSGVSLFNCNATKVAITEERMIDSYIRTVASHRLHAPFSINQTSRIRSP